MRSIALVNGGNRGNSSVYTPSNRGITDNRGIPRLEKYWRGAICDPLNARKVILVQFEVVPRLASCHLVYIHLCVYMTTARFHTKMSVPRLHDGLTAASHYIEWRDPA